MFFPKKSPVDRDGGVANVSRRIGLSGFFQQVTQHLVKMIALFHDIRLQIVCFKFVARTEGSRCWIRDESSQAIRLSGWLAGLCRCLLLQNQCVRPVLEAKWFPGFPNLDWTKAFGYISPDGLFVALQRFGIPLIFCRMIHKRNSCKFVVCDAGSTSQNYFRIF